MEDNGPICQQIFRANKKVWSFSCAQFWSGQLSAIVWDWSGIVFGTCHTNDLLTRVIEKAALYFMWMDGGWNIWGVTVDGPSKPSEIHVPAWRWWWLLCVLKTLCWCTFAVPGKSSATCHLLAVCHMAYSFREIWSLGKDLLDIYPYLVSTTGVQFYFKKRVWYFRLVHDASCYPVTMLQTKPPKYTRVGVKSY
jgi:hypothetical protein